MFRFVHAADLHLDSPLKGLERYEGAPVAEIRGATRRALDNLVRLAIDEKVAFVLIAGDVFDRDWEDHNTGLFFHQRMSQLREAGIPVIAISGNHDADSRMAKSLQYPANVTLLSSTRVETKVFEELSVAIHGRGFATAMEAANVIGEFPSPVAGCFNIGMLHTSLETEVAGEHARYAPCKISDLLRREYNYWALGHIHQRAVLHESPPVVYSGNPQGRHVREPGERGCYLVSVDDRRQTTLEFRSLDVLRWLVCTVSAEGVRSDKEFLARFSDEVERQLEEHGNRLLAIRLELAGRTERHGHWQANRVGWTNQLRACATDLARGRVWLESIRLRTKSARAATANVDEDGPLAELVTQIQHLRETDADLRSLIANDAASDLLSKLPRELAEELDLRSLLDDVEPILLAKLQS